LGYSPFDYAITGELNALFSNQVMSQQERDLPDINWSKLSGTILARTSHALTEAKQLV